MHPIARFHHLGAGHRDLDAVDLFGIFTVDPDGTRRDPDPSDPATAWLAVVMPAGQRTYKVVWARPSMASIGQRFGAAGLLTNRMVMRQVERLHYDLERRDVADDQPPVHLNRDIIRALA